MNIKERIEKIIDDYSFAKDEAEQRNRIKTMYKGAAEATESTWDYVKDPILLKVKGLVPYVSCLNKTYTDIVKKFRR